ncbi:MAG: DUF4124 domain-containing protein [Burkholderiaceae bacterium]
MPAAARPRLAPLLALILAAVLAQPLAAQAQWAWRDTNGTVVFSDQAPPASVKANQIVRQPRAAAVNVTPDQAPAAAPTQSSAAAKPAGLKSLAERELDFQKRQKESAEAANKAADDERQQSRQAAECERARGYLKALESGQRVAQVSPSGQRSFLDDGQRASEIERSRQSVQTFCH